MDSRIQLASPVVTNPARSESRVASIDAARGSAMLFVCLAHFTNAYFFLNGHETIGANLVVIGMLASPTFVTVSGLVAGFLAVTRAPSFPGLRRKLIDRGLFLLVVGHFILALSGIATGAGFAHAYRVEYITDAIGFAILFGPRLISVLSPAARIAVAGTVFGLNWLAVLAVAPSDALSITAKQYLVGAVTGGHWGSPAGGFALFPWFAVYLVGTVIGERVGTHYRAGARQRAHAWLATIGLISAATGLALKLAMVVASRMVPGLIQTYPMLNGLSIYQKFPPGLVYLLFFGGGGMVLVATVLEVGRHRPDSFLLNQLRQIGLASFFVYIIQFYFYGVVLHMLRLPYTPLWPLIFVASVALLAVFANVWNLKAGNRFLTMGIEPLLSRISRRRRVVMTNAASI